MRDDQSVFERLALGFLDVVWRNAWSLRRKILRILNILSLVTNILFERERKKREGDLNSASLDDSFPVPAFFLSIHFFLFLFSHTTSSSQLIHVFAARFSFVPSPSSSTSCPDRTTIAILLITWLLRMRVTPILFSPLIHAATSR